MPRRPWQASRITDSGWSQRSAAIEAANAPRATTASEPPVIASLRRLDVLLEQAIERARAAFGVGLAEDAHRGLVIREDEVDRLLARAPGESALAVHVVGPQESPWQRVAEAFHIGPFELDVLLLALAPELDLRYERIYGYLQDDVTRRRPSVALALDLFCSSAEERLAARERFESPAPLRRRRLLSLVAEPGHADPPLLGRSLVLDEPVVSSLLGRPALDPLLADACELVEPTAAMLPPALERLAERARTRMRTVLHLHGFRGSGRRRAGAALAACAGKRLHAIDLARALDADRAFAETLACALRDAELNDAVPYLAGLDPLLDPERASDLRTLTAALSDAPALTIVSSEVEWRPVPRPAGFVSIELPVPDATARRAIWSAGTALSEAELDVLASRFRLTSGQIRDAIEEARTAAGGEPDGPAVFAGARDQAGGGLAGLARKTTPARRLEEIVLPPDRLEQLRALCDHVRYRAIVHEQWGFARRLGHARGLNVLFAGPSGTGKTMAAEIVAGELGLDLYVIDLAAVVSKYIGETEKNLAKIFDAAASASAVLFFDEADALFGKRSEVRDSHDRYANIEIAYLLQRMEDYDGVAIIATNLRKNLDDAFVRRMHFMVDFPMPDYADRLRIWKGMWPEELPLERDVDMAALARRYPLAGGSIRNVALASAFLAAADGGRVRQEHLLAATRREYQKMGAVVRTEDFDGTG
jgi:ATPase family associated with various cellular activities (AAA)